MSLVKYEVDGEIFYVDDELKKEETGVVSLDNKSEDFEKTQEIDVINEEDLLSDTLTDVFGDNNE